MASTDHDGQQAFADHLGTPRMSEEQTGGSDSGAFTVEKAAAEVASQRTTEPGVFQVAANEHTPDEFSQIEAKEAFARFRRTQAETGERTPEAPIRPVKYHTASERIAEATRLLASDNAQDQALGIGLLAQAQQEGDHKHATKTPSEAAADIASYRARLAAELDGQIAEQQQSADQQAAQAEAVEQPQEQQPQQQPLQSPADLIAQAESWSCPRIPKSAREPWSLSARRSNRPKRKIARSNIRWQGPLHSTPMPWSGWSKQRWWPSSVA